MPGPANRIPARVWEERVFCEKCGTQVTRYERVEETMCAEELIEWSQGGKWNGKWPERKD